MTVEELKELNYLNISTGSYDLFDLSTAKLSTRCAISLNSISIRLYNVNLTNYYVVICYIV